MILLLKTSFAEHNNDVWDPESCIYLAGFDIVPNKTANLSNVKVCRIHNLGRPALIAKEITEP